MNKLRIAITGATGLLGRNLLFEFLKQHFDDLNSLEIFILGRDKSDLSIERRIKDIVLNDGLDYLSLNNKNDIEKIKKYCDSGIRSIYTDLDEERLDIKWDDFKKLKEAPIDFFFHVAALTDFRNTPNVMKALKKTNVYGTKQTLQLMSAIKIGEFCYVGSAYSCGYTFGKIEPDYINFDQRFRNPYEQTKLEAEVLVRNYAKKTGTKCRYFRPSTICGRLIEHPVGAINKFDVFYAWAAFFLYMKLKHLNRISRDEIYRIPFNVDMRLYYSLKSGVNIVPADYAAKVIYQVCLQKDLNESYYLSNNQETSHDMQISSILKVINIKGAKQVDFMPEQTNQLECFYYKTAGKIYTPYITADPMLFNVQNLNNVLQKAKLKCPPVDENNFSMLLEYAKKRDFGVDVNEVLLKESQIK